MLFALLSIAAVLPGSVATFLEHVNGPLRLAERHHSHHDTYVVSPDFTRALVVATLMVGCIGVMLSLLCFMGVFLAGYLQVLAFTNAFAYTMFALWICLVRYKVALFEDHVVVTPCFGNEACLFYSDIVETEWVGVRRRSGYRDLRLIAKDDAVTVRGVVDIEQVLLHVDRFDVLAPLGGGEDSPLENLAKQLRAQDSPVRVRAARSRDTKKNGEIDD